MATIRSKPQVNNTTKKLGVSKSWKTDRRREGNPRTLRFQVRYIDEMGKVCVKGFDVGREGDFTEKRENEVFKKACKFRDEYEVLIKTLEMATKVGE